MVAGMTAAVVLETHAGTHWAAGATAVATSVTALGIFFAAVGAIWAGRQVREAERSRHAEMATHMTSRWAGKPLADAREALHGKGGRVGIRNSYLAVVRGEGTAEDRMVHAAARTIMDFSRI